MTDSTEAYSGRRIMWMLILGRPNSPHLMTKKARMVMFKNIAIGKAASENCSKVLALAMYAIGERTRPIESNVFIPQPKAN
jgi:hypothetical protein